jgi:predicted  nucleic acid-binding Zn-ribbon protein
MALFKQKSPMKTLQKQLAELRFRDAALAEKLKAAEAALAEATGARQKHLLSGDLADEQTANKLQANVDSCSSKMTGLTSAIEALGVQINEIERKLEAEELALARATAGEKLAARVATVDVGL